MFHGSIPALITPFKNGHFDTPAYQKLIEWQMAMGSSALVTCGTTGESPTLSHEEWQLVVKTAVAVANKKVPVIAGTGSNNTSKTIEMTQKAKDLGVDAALVVVPYYNKPTQEGLFQHFKAVHDASALPIILYNVPGRTVTTLSVETVGRLAQLPRIVGIKDATANLERPALERAVCPDDFCFLSGEDGTALAYLAMGGHGCISVTANVAPKQSANLQAAWVAGDIKTATRICGELAELNSLLFCESNPGPVKYIAAQMGLCALEYRLPLVAPSEENQRRLDALIKNSGLRQAAAA